jgi:hypothetical protein
MAESLLQSIFFSPADDTSLPPCVRRTFQNVLEAQSPHTERIQMRIEQVGCLQENLDSHDPRDQWMLEELERLVIFDPEIKGP